MNPKQSNNQHVVPHKGAWAVRAEGSERVTSRHTTQSAAIGAARTIAQNQKSEMFIHAKNGQIRERNTYGPDQCPPIG